MAELVDALASGASGLQAVGVRVSLPAHTIMEHNEELVLIDGNEVVINHSPVRMYSEDGRFVGMGTLNDVIAKNLWCKSVHAWIINSRGELYIHQRSFKVLNNPGKWGESCGGYVDGDMTEEETLRTEMLEEIGLSLDSAHSYEKIGDIRQFEKRYDGSYSQQFVSVFLVTFDFNPASIQLSERDVLQGRLVEWRMFKQELEAGTIDFVDHKEELACLFAELERRA